MDELLIRFNCLNTQLNYTLFWKQRWAFGYHERWDTFDRMSNY